MESQKIAEQIAEKWQGTLLPCPSCKSANVDLSLDCNSSYWVYCADCGMCGPKEHANRRGKKWNALPRTTTIAAALDAAVGQDVDALAADVLEMCKLRGWSLRWTERGAYLHLEASELIEAIRGKHGDPLREAADVLLVLMSITENAGIPFSAVIEATRATTTELKAKPHYAGEEFSRKGEGEA